MDERTLRPYKLGDAATIRSAVFQAQPGETGRRIGTEAFPDIPGWRIKQLLEEREHCILYLAEGERHQPAVIKLLMTEPENVGALKRVCGLSTTKQAHLLPMLDFGMAGERYYEVYPYYPAGTLEGVVLEPEVVLNVVLPQLICAIRYLHRHQLIHNDIKPSNIFWVEKNRQIVLGDYDTIDFFPGRRSEQKRGTPAFMAPEILIGGASHAGPASDMCSMGVTLLALLTGVSPLSGKTEVQMRRAWMRGISISDSVPHMLRILINGLTDYDADKRLSAEGVYHWMTTYGVKPIQEKEFEDAAETTSIQQRQPIWFRDQPVRHISELIAQCGKDWRFGCFLLEQKKLSGFLRQFDLRYYELCIECERIFDKNEGLFTLLHTLSCSEDFYWYGRHYSSLEDFVTCMLDKGDLTSSSEGAHFLRANMLGVYLKNTHESEEKLSFAQRLSQIAQHRPELAMTQLLATMSAMPELKWKEQVFHTLSDLADWLSRADGSIDELIGELFASKRFEAWLTFIDEGAMLNDIRNDMKRISL